MKSFTTALSAIMCICAAQESWGYDLFLEDTLTESEQQATPSPSPISTEWSTVEETDETTVVSTDSSSIMPSDDKCDVSESAGGVRMLRGTSLSQEETERIMTAAYVGVNGKRRLQNTHPCVVRGTKIGDRCLVITDIKIVMTAWYINPGGGKTEIGSTDTIRSILLLASKFGKGKAKDDVTDFFQDYLNIGLNAFTTLFPKEVGLVKIFIEQIGVDLHAQVNGDVYVWTHR